jgi:hypothetical protein
MPYVSPNEAFALFADGLLFLLSVFLFSLCKAVRKENGLLYALLLAGTASLVLGLAVLMANGLWHEHNGAARTGTDAVAKPR